MVAVLATAALHHCSWQLRCFSGGGVLKAEGKATVITNSSNEHNTKYFATTNNNNSTSTSYVLLGYLEFSGVCEKEAH